MFQKKLEMAFIVTTLLAISFLFYNLYSSYSFKNSEIPQSYKNQITLKEQEILSNMQKEFGFSYQFPLIVTDKFKGRLYGLTSYDNGKITIYLNKKVMQESMTYMVDSVIAHEYAHALIFKLGLYNKERGGHSKEWQETCVRLGGKDCREYVNSHEVIMAKMPFQSR
ncbi:MAG: SprT-like domain-containing protein [Campylobacterota bacterium]|nr:SprT-like domain-containing protein [Campylobacterota bacterium]